MVHLWPWHSKHFLCSGWFVPYTTNDMLVWLCQEPILIRVDSGALARWTFYHVMHECFLYSVINLHCVHFISMERASQSNLCFIFIEPWLIVMANADDKLIFRTLTKYHCSSPFFALFVHKVGLNQSIYDWLSLCKLLTEPCINLDFKQSSLNSL